MKTLYDAQSIQETRSIRRGPYIYQKQHIVGLFAPHKAVNIISYSNHLLIILCEEKR